MSQRRSYGSDVAVLFLGRASRLPVSLADITRVLVCDDALHVPRERESEVASMRGISQATIIVAGLDISLPSAALVALSRRS